MFTNSDDRNPPYVMSKLGYDVWMINSRGNKHSNAHVEYSKTESKFWDFSFEDMGKDLKSSISYIKEETNKSKIILVVHSQGGSIFFSAASKNPSFFNANVQSIIALAPAVFINHSSNKFFHAVSSLNLESLISHLPKVGLVDVAGYNVLSFAVCKLSGIKFQSFAELVMSKNMDAENLDRVPVLISHYPAGVNMKNVIHFVQLFTSGKFQAYDYGEKENLFRYGTTTPMEYPLDNYSSKVRTHLIAGSLDETVPAMDLERLCNELGTNCNTFDILEGYTHYSFLIGKGYEHIEKLIQYADEDSS